MLEPTPDSPRVEEQLLRQEACSRHPGRLAIATCSGCAEFLCRPCHEAGVRGFELFCPGCRGEDEEDAGAPEEALSRAQSVPAGFWPRLLAYILDSMLLDGLRAGVYLLLGGESNPLPQGQTLSLFTVALAMGLHALYHVFFWVRFGATPGKALLGLKVVRATDGGALSIGMAVQRWLGYMLGTLAFGLGFLAIIWDQEKRGWHDRLAGTLVVRLGAGGRDG